MNFQSKLEYYHTEEEGFEAQNSRSELRLYKIPFGLPPALYSSITLYFDSKTNLFLSFDSYLFVSAFKQMTMGA